MSPSIFKGFAAGSTVTIGGISVNAWGQVEGGETVWDQPSAPGVSVTINVSRSAHRVAPEGVFFSSTLAGFDTNTADSIAKYDPSYHDKVYFWDYGESYIYTAPTQVIAMDAADGGTRTDSRYSLGPLGAHVFRTPDSHMVRLAVLEPSTGKWGQATLPISVADPRNFYSGPATIFVDRTGAYANAPSGAQRFTSLTDAFSALGAAMTPHRIVLERGQTHMISSTLRFRPPSNASAVSLRIEAAEGRGARPVIQASSSFSGSDMILDRSLLEAQSIDTGSVISGLDLRGTWDVTTETGQWNLTGIHFGNARANHCLVDDCEIRNINVGFRTTDLDAPARNSRLYFLNDSSISDWSNYGIFDADQGHTCVLGSRIAQNPDAITGGNKDNAHNNHGPFRAGTPNRTVFLSSDFFSSTGWSLIGSIRAVQPAIRWNTGPVWTGAQLNMQSCALESSAAPIVISAATNRSNSRLTNAIIEGTLVLGGHNAGRLIGLTCGGLTLRNNVLVFAETESDATPIGGQSRSPTAFVETATNGDGNGTDAANLAAPILIYNNTLVNLANAGSGATVWRDTVMGFSAEVISNNVIHEPNIGTPNTSHAPLLRIVAFTPRYKGYRRDASTLYTAYAPSPDSASIWVPEIGSSALGTALTEPNASTDFRGNLRPEPPSIGAFEAD